jgi:serine/threonine protein kinase
MSGGLPPFRKCLWCKVSAAEGFCGHCRRACYCSRECLAADWSNGHHGTCVRITSDTVRTIGVIRDHTHRARHSCTSILGLPFVLERPCGDDASDDPVYVEADIDGMDVKPMGCSMAASRGGRTRTTTFSEVPRAASPAAPSTCTQQAILGKGSFGVVTRVQCGAYSYAVKRVVEKGEWIAQDTLSETFARNFNHPNVVNVCACVQKPNEKALDIFMDEANMSLTTYAQKCHAQRKPDTAPTATASAPGTTTSTSSTSTSPSSSSPPAPTPGPTTEQWDDDLIVVLYQMVRAIAYLHSLLVVNLDVKPDNFLVAAAPVPDELRKRAGAGTVSAKVIPRVIASDMGFCKANVVGSAFVVNRGTPYYMSPELLFGRDIASPASDVWSLGVSMWEVATGKFPLQTNATTIDGWRRHVVRFTGNPVPESPWVTRTPAWGVISNMVGSLPDQAPDAFSGIVPRGLESVIRWMVQFEPANRSEPSSVLYAPVFTELKLPKYGGLPAARVVEIAFPAPEKIRWEPMLSAKEQQRAAPVPPKAPEATPPNAPEVAPLKASEATPPNAPETTQPKVVPLEAWRDISTYIVEFFKYEMGQHLPTVQQNHEIVLCAFELLRGILGHSGGTLPAEISEHRGETALALLCMASELCERKTFTLQVQLGAFARRGVDVKAATRLQWRILELLDYDVMRPDSSTFVDIIARPRMLALVRALATRERVANSPPGKVVDTLARPRMRAPAMRKREPVSPPEKATEAVAKAAAEAAAAEAQWHVEYAKAMCAEVHAALSVSGAMTSCDIAEQVFGLVCRAAGMQFSDLPPASLEVRRCLAGRLGSRHTMNFDTKLEAVFQHVHYELENEEFE